MVDVAADTTVPQSAPPSPSQPPPGFVDNMQKAEGAVADSEKHWAAGTSALAPATSALSAARRDLSNTSSLIPNPQKLPPAPDAAEYHKNAMAFASAMAVLGAVSSTFARVPGSAALNAFTGALKGWQTGNLQAYESAAKQWEQNTKAAIEKNRQDVEAYRLILENKKLNIDQMSAEVARVAAERHDTIMYDFARAKHYVGFTQAYERKVEFTQKAEESAARLQQRRDEQAERTKSSANYWVNHPEEFGKLSPAQQATVKQLMEIHKMGFDTTPGPQTSITSPTQVAALPPSGTATDAGGTIPAQADASQSGGVNRAMENLGWNKETLDAAARTFNKTGKLPTNLGTRQYAGLISGAIQKRATELLSDEGKTPEERTKDWQLYKAAQPAINSFMAGVNGRTTRSLGVVVDHLETMRELGDALKNGNMQAFNRAAQWIATQTGQPAPTNLSSAAGIVGPEIIKALGVAGAGTAHERDAAGANFSQIRSPEQINGAINTMQPLLAGQLEGLERQWRVGTGLPVDLFYAQVGEKGTKWLQRKGERRSTSGGDEAPQPGHTEDGYRFKGGDPADKSNWEKL